MPYTLKSARAKFKDANGDYKEFDLISENSTAEQLTAIEAKGAATLASIPADYTALSDSVDDLKSALNAVADEVFYGPVRAATTSVDGWRLNESDGLCSQNSKYKLVKYSVNAGDIIRVVSDDRFQFQTNSSVPATGTPFRVGPTYMAGTFTVIVPETATYLIVSTPISNSGASVSSYSEGITNYKGVLPNNTDFNSVQTNSIYGIRADWTYSNKPIYSGFLITLVFQNGIFSQIACELLFNGIHSRRCINGNWSEWIHANNASYEDVRGILPDGTDLNNVTDGSIYGLSSSRTYSNKPPVTSGVLRTTLYDFGGICMQTVISFGEGVFCRYKISSWSNWQRMDFGDRSNFQRINGRLPDNTDFDDIKENGIWGLDSAYTFPNDPLPSSGFLECRSFNNSDIWVQTARDLLNEISYTRWYFNSWSDWEADGFHDARKVYYAFGDSTTYGQVGGVGGQSNYNYPKVAGRLLKMKTKNMAVGGQGLIKDWSAIHTNYINNLDMSDAKLITIGWAYNDSGYYSGIPFGNYTDTSSSSFIGKYFTIMKEFQQKCPKAKIILITGYGTPDGQVGPPVVKPTLETQFTYEYTFSDGKHTTKEMYDTLEKMCHLHGWSCINQSKGTVFNQWNANELIGDQIHPNNDGYLLYGNYLGGQIASMYGNISY